MNPTTGQQIAFYSMAALTLIPAIGVVYARSIIHAGFLLLPCFLGVAGLFATLEAHFFFVVQLLVYAGAILVLILFALMLTRNVMNPHKPMRNRIGLWAALIAGAISLLSAYLLWSHPWGIVGGPAPGGEQQTRMLGEALIGQFALPFEVASLLLLAALVGSVVLAKSEAPPTLPPPPMLDLPAPAPTAAQEPAATGPLP